MIKRFFVSGRTVSNSPLLARERSVPAMRCGLSVATQTASRFRKLLACMPRKGRALPESWKEYFRQRLKQIPTLG
jgi:hypothetical protein